MAETRRQGHSALRVKDGKIEKFDPHPVATPTPQEFYEANATNVCNVPRPGHPEDPSGWAGVRRASEARFVAGDALVMTLADTFDFAEKYQGAYRK